MAHSSHFRETEPMGTFSSLPSKILIPNFIVPSKWQRHKMSAEERARPYGLNLSALSVCPCWPHCQEPTWPKVSGVPVSSGTWRKLGTGPLPELPRINFRKCCATSTMNITSAAETPRQQQYSDPPDLTLLLTAQVSQKKVGELFLKSNIAEGCLKVWKTTYFHFLLSKYHFPFITREL